MEVDVPTAATAKSLLVDLLQDGLGYHLLSFLSWGDLLNLALIDSTTSRSG